MPVPLPLPAAPVGAIDVFKDFPLQKLRDALSDWAQQLGSVADTEINKKLKSAKAGDSLGPFVVLDHTLANQTITLQLRGTYPLLGQSAFVRSRFQFKDEIALSSGPVVSNFKLLSFMAEIKVKKDPLYECALGYGFDLEPRPYSVGRGMIDLVGPGIRLDVFLGGLSDNGIALALSVGGSGNAKSTKFPLLIPLGATGLGISGIGGSFAHNFEPILKPDAAADPPNPTAQDYVSWAKRDTGDELDIWRPASANGAYRGGLGINCDLVTLDGYLLRFHKVGFAYLSYGPVIFFGGSGIFLQSDICKVDAMAAFDFGSGSVDATAGASIEIPPDGKWKIIEAIGAMEMFLSTSSPGNSFFNLGTDSSPIHGSFLTDIAQASVYLMINTRRVKAGGSLRFGFQADLGPFKVALFYALNGSALLGWNPIQIEAGLGLSGGLKACAFGLCLGMELGGNIDVAVPHPVRFALTVTLSLDLPWPLPNVSWTGKVFDYSTKDDYPNLTQALLLGIPAAAGSSTVSFGAVHARTGRQWKLDDQIPARIWPDSDLVLPFNRKVTDRAGIVMGPGVAASSEGGFTVNHELLSLRVIHLTKKPDGSVVETPVTGLRALWVAGPDGDISRLHVPCEDPFSWLFPYPTTQGVAHVSLPAYVVQDFGGGPAEYAVSKRVFGSIVITPQGTVDLQYLPTEQKLTRFLAGTDFKIELAEPGTNRSIAVSSLVLTVATSDQSSWNSLMLETGFKSGALKKVFEIGGNLSLCTLEISRADGKPFSKLELSAAIHQVCPTEEPGREPHQCYKKLLVYSIGFIEVIPPDVDWQKRVVLTPGIYRCEVTGQSSVFGYGQSPKSIAWLPYKSQEFHVIYPEQLRPYIHFVTMGDSRIFNEMPQLWNPTPFGRGFPTYGNDVGTIRFNASYLSSIFTALTVEIVDSAHIATPLVVSPKANVDGDTSLSNPSLAWRKQYQPNVPSDEELTLNTNSPWRPGVGHLRILYSDQTQTPAVDVLLDEWNFEVSRFKDVSEHLEIKTSSIETIYTAEGPEHVPLYSWPSSPLPSSPPVKPSIPIDWALPQGLATLVSADLESKAVPTASLRFLRFAQRLGTRFELGNENALVGIIGVSQTTRIEAAIDRERRAYALLLRTPEPLDWQRVSLTITLYPIQLQPSGQFSFANTHPISFSARFVPNFDGTQAFLVAYIDDVAVRLPRGAYELKFVYKRKLNNLPTITSKSEGSADKIVTQHVIYSVGPDWSS
jgi:hypothetical protein